MTIGTPRSIKGAAVTGPTQAARVWQLNALSTAGAAPREFIVGGEAKGVKDGR